MTIRFRYTYYIACTHTAVTVKRSSNEPVETGDATRDRSPTSDWGSKPFLLHTRAKSRKSAKKMWSQGRRNTKALIGNTVVEFSKKMLFDNHKSKPSFYLHPTKTHIKISIKTNISKSYSFFGRGGAIQIHRTFMFSFRETASLRYIRTLLYDMFENFTGLSRQQRLPRTKNNNIDTAKNDTLKVR